jgi:hypothetical protein
MNYNRGDEIEKRNLKRNGQVGDECKQLSLLPSDKKPAWEVKTNAQLDLIGMREPSFLVGDSSETVKAEKAARVMTPLILSPKDGH